MYRPLSSLITVRAVPVSAFLIVTDTPGMTAPDASCATPEIVPVVTWAKSRWPLKRTLIHSTGKYRDTLSSSRGNQKSIHKPLFLDGFLRLDRLLLIRIRDC